ncbi:hypothetical protein GTO91_09765 [Heliobacterium undosum]|uniref:histidine kinase n=1 Tax=Heliomicrobium undosum TaxID=121734 RepID=A0A845L5P6_9FIRM|nr:HAMP domain-containing sensor histidine kinase [Heliomicrobium undosum]MZP29990.1 hypothetical protein [Heliomicrobium undosum]
MNLFGWVTVVFIVFLGTGIVFMAIVYQEVRRMQRLLAEAIQGNRQVRFYSHLSLLHPIAEQVNILLQQLHIQESNKRRDDEQRRQFITAITHDLRTPLASVLGYLEAVHKGLTNPDKKDEYIETAYHKGLTLLNTLNRFFEWAKLDLHQEQIFPQTINLAETHREVLIEFLPGLEARGIQLIAEIPLVVNVTIDPETVARVIRNLIQNAIDHALDVTMIRVRLDVNKRQTLIEDNGKGKPEVDDDDIFEPFQRQRKSKGLGLGLAISRQLLRMQKGNLYAEPSEEGGLSFIIQWPSA